MDSSFQQTCSHMNNTTNQQLNEKLCEEIKIPVPFGHISGVWWGSKNKQPVLALHGWQDNAGTWDRLIPLLSNEISILAIDLPGHGLSSHYPPGQIYYLFWDSVHLVKKIAKYFNWEKFTIMGHSLGGAIGFLYAAVFPHDVDKLIQIDIVHPGVWHPPTDVSVCAEIVNRFLKYETLTEDNIPCYSYEQMIDLLHNAHRGSVTRDSCKILLKRDMVPSPKGNGYYFARDVRLKIAGLGFLSLELVLEFALKIKCNVLNIKGNPGMLTDQHYDNYQMVLDKMRTNAHVEFHEIEGAHHLHLNNPERIYELVNKFLLQPVISDDAHLV